jgi:hypothetical protein
MLTVSILKQISYLKKPHFVDIKGTSDLGLGTTVLEQRSRFVLRFYCFCFKYALSILVTSHILVSSVSGKRCQDHTVVWCRWDQLVLSVRKPWFSSLLYLLCGGVCLWNSLIAKILTSPMLSMKWRSTYERTRNVHRILVGKPHEWPVLMWEGNVAACRPVDRRRPRDRRLYSGRY